MTPIADNLSRVRSEIAEAARAAGRDPAGITLIAVGKTHAADIIRPAIEAGQRDFGENRVQEAAAKWPDLKAEHPDLRLHLIGPLQSNKAADAVALFDVIHSVDRPKIARALAKEMTKQGRRLPCFVQVNTGEEPQKAGVAPEGALDFVRACQTDHGLDVVGLMCIPPLDADPAPHFDRLAGLAREAGLAGLSMGMTADYALAVRHGATHVRVGTAIFGPRES